jgi:predicted aspartyl protease
MGIIRVPVILRPLAGGDPYQNVFLVDTGTTDCMAPGPELARVGIDSEGKRSHELADGSSQEYDYGFARIEFQGDVTVGRVVFGPNGTEPILGVTALESAGFTIDPVNGELKRMPAIPLKRFRRRARDLP